MSDPNADAQLPPGWSRGYSNSQKRGFYFHNEQKHTQWHFPTASEAKDPAKAKQRAQMNKEQERKRPPEDNSSKRPRDSNSSSASASASAPSKKTKAVDNFLELADSTSVAIIVPYRDIHATQQRAAHLSKFIPHMRQFLGKLRTDGLVSDYHVYIIEQSDDSRKFNRGKLLNIGFDLARKSGRNHDVFIFHDVDLLPQPDLGVWYSKFPKAPIHIARVWDRYSNNPKYFGGVVSFSSSDYKRINGYPNTFWGWGGEDDEMQKRLERLGIKWESPNKGTLIDLENMTLPEKLDFLRANREWKCMVKWEALEEHETTWRSNGMADLKYSVLETKSLSSYVHETTREGKSNTTMLLYPYKAHVSSSIQNKEGPVTGIKRKFSIVLRI
jgi:hypothetical protein